MISLERERAIVMACLEDKAVMSSAAIRLSEYQWSERELGWIWNQCREMHAKVPTEKPDWRLIHSAIKMLPAKDQEAKQLELKEVLRTEPEPNPEQWLLEMQELHRSREMLEVMERASEQMERGDRKAALETFAKGARSKAVLGSGTLTRAGVEKVRVKDRFLWRSPTMIKSLDRQLKGGAAKGDVNLILGRSGVGKSFMCTTIVYGAIRAGHKVLYIDTENGRRTVLDRLYSRIVGISMDDLQPPPRSDGTVELSPHTLDRLNSWLARNGDRVNKLFQHVDARMGTVQMAQVAAEIQKAIDDGFHPDVVVFDSPDQLAMDGKSDRWQQFVENNAELLRITKRFNVAMWATSQVNTQGEAADSKTKVENAGVVIKISRPGENSKEPAPATRYTDSTGAPIEFPEMRILEIRKNRHGQAGNTLAMRCNLKFMKQSTDELVSP